MAIDGSATTIEVTPEAATKLQELRADDPKRAFLRLYVSGRSCCSFMYGLAFDENADETDAVTDNRFSCSGSDQLNRYPTAAVCL